VHEQSIAAVPTIHLPQASTTGLINLANSSPGTYEISYAISCNFPSLIAKDTIVSNPGGSVNTQNMTASSPSPFIHCLSFVKQAHGV
jgi:hypothetical protein